MWFPLRNDIEFSYVDNAMMISFTKPINVGRASGGTSFSLKWGQVKPKKKLIFKKLIGTEVNFYFFLNNFPLFTGF